MKNRSLTFLALIALLFSLSAHAQGPAYVPGDLLVMMRPGTSPWSVVEGLRSVNGISTGIDVAEEVSTPMRAWLFRFDANAIAQDVMLRAAWSHPSVQMAQNNHVVTERQVPNDAQYAQQWHHQNINSEAAWEIGTGGVTATGDSIVVCIIETADLPHADLIGNAWFNQGEVAGNGIDDDANGYVDDRRGWNPPGNNDAVYGGGHGTQVAGMIGAKGNNTTGVTGANWNVKMMVVNYGGTSEAQVVSAYTYPLVMRRLYTSTGGQKGAFVVATNASWGVDGGNPANSPIWCAMYDTLGTAGILSCGATANNNVNVDQVGDLPTACPSDFMVSVTATNTADNRTFSAYGLTTIDVGAPGENVRTTSLGGGYGTTSGTSFASPLTAGVIGLLYSAPCPSLMALVQADPAAGALYIRNKLFEGVDQVGNLGGQTVTGGRINAGTSMQLIMNNCSACVPPFGGNVTATDATSATFSWSNTISGPYTIRYGIQGSGQWTVVPDLQTNSYAAIDLAACTAYEFQVESVCEEGTSGFGPSTVLAPVLVSTPTVSLAGAPLLCTGEVALLTSSASNGNTWSTGDQGQVLQVSEPGSYSVTVTGPCNTATSTPIAVDFVPVPSPGTNDVTIPGPGTASLTASGDSISWWSAETGGNLLGNGSPWETPMLFGGATFWCSNTVVSQGPAVYGARADRTTAGQYHTNGSFWLVFTANEAFTLRSVKVFANGAGSRPIALVNMPSGSVVTQANYSIPDGESRVQLDLLIPGPGQYGLRIASGDPQLWRDGTASGQSFPYPLGTLGSITGTTATGSNATALYYFFYDWEVEPLPLVCTGERVPVNVELLTTGMTENDELVGVHAYPNPADRDLFLDVRGPLTGLRLEARITDSTGRLVARKPVENGRATLTTADLEEGLYTYHIMQGNSEVGRGTFVVTHLW